MKTIIMRFPEGKKKALTLSYDDGVEQDIRLVEIMKANGLKGTFNVNTGLYAPEGKVYPEGTIHRRMTKDQVTKLYTENGMEVAVHGLHHPHLESLPINLCLSDVAKDRENLEEQFGKIIRGMAYPYGTYNDQVVECLKCAGIVYSRTVAATRKFSLPTDWLRLPATCHHKDEMLMELAHKFVEKDPGLESWLFYLWGHSYEFDMDNNWHVIEEFAEYIGHKDDIWYATNIEIYEYMEAYNRLVFGMDGKRVFNPTTTRLYFEMNKITYCVEPGEEKYLG